MGKVFTLTYAPVEGCDPLEARMGKAEPLGPFRCGDYLDLAAGQWLEGHCAAEHETWEDALACLCEPLPGGGVDDIEFGGVRFTPIKTGAGEHQDAPNWRPPFTRRNVSRKGGA